VGLIFRGRDSSTFNSAVERESQRKQQEKNDRWRRGKKNRKKKSINKTALPTKPHKQFLL